MAKQLKYGEEARRALEAGMNAHLPKPMDVEKLCGMIERLRK